MSCSCSYQEGCFGCIALRAQLAAAERVVDAARGVFIHTRDCVYGAPCDCGIFEIRAALAAYDAAKALRDPPPGGDRVHHG